VLPDPAPPEFSELDELELGLLELPVLLLEPYRLDCRFNELELESVELPEVDVLDEPCAPRLLEGWLELSVE